MPDFDVTLNLPGFTIAKTSGFNPIVRDLESRHERHCPHCAGCGLRKMDKVHRHVWHETVGLRRVLLRFSVCKYHCRACGKYFRQRLDGIQPWQRSTEARKSRPIPNTAMVSRAKAWHRTLISQTARSRASMIICATWAAVSS